MKKGLLFIAATIIVQLSVFSQNTVGIGTATPNTNAVLDVVSSSNNQGFLLPRLTNAQMNTLGASLNATDTGLLIYNSSFSGFYYWTGSSWQGVGATTAWSVTGNAGTALPSNFLGTTDAQYLDLRTNNASRILLYPDGRISIGSANTVTGTLALAMGRNNIAAGTSAIALGSYAEANHFGSVVLSDLSASTPTTQSSANNEFTSRFDGGYRFYTSSSLTEGSGVFFNNSGRVGVGTSNTTRAGLQVASAVGPTNATFEGPTGIGVSIQNSYPSIGFNEYYNAGSYSMAAGYTGKISMNPTTGDFHFILGNNPGIPNSPAILLYRMTLTNGGNLGIGTNSPSSRLDVIGNIEFTGDLRPANLPGTAGQVLVSQGSGVAPVWTDQSAIDDGDWSNAGTGAMYSTNATDNVGIGTSTPDSKLHVAENVADLTGTDGAFIDIQNLNTSGSNGYMSGIRFRADGITSGTDSRFKGGVLFQKTGSFGIGNLIFATNNAGSNASVTTADARMLISSSGDIGIGTGTTTPVNRLQVQGDDAGSASTDGVINALNQTDVGGVGIATRVNLNNATGIGNRYGIQSQGWYGLSSNYGGHFYSFGGSISYGIYALGGGSTTNWAGYFSGNTFSTGTYQGSDAKLKQNIHDFNNATSVLKAIPIKTYEYKQDEKHEAMNFPKGVQVGLLAEDLKEVMPSLVKKNVFDVNHDKMIKNPELNLQPEYYEFDVVNYTGLIPVTIRAFQEQEERIAQLEEEIEWLKKQLEK